MHRQQTEEVRQLQAIRITGELGLHASLRDYKAWSAERTKNVDGSQTEWGVKVGEMIDRFIERHEDIPIADLTLAKCEEMMAYWQNRPRRKNSETPIAKNTARNQLIQLRAFLRWLGRQEKYGWKRPADLFDSRVRIPETKEEISRKVQGVPVYTLDELKILFSNATERMRLFMLLALNCAFKQAEIGGLFKHEIKLNHLHPHYKIRGNFIFRVRQKRRVYGQWKLWPETVDALVKAMAESRTSSAIVTEKGTSYGDLTKGGNHNQKIPNRWYRLLDKVDGLGVRRMGFTSLVDTAVDMVRDVAGGEVAAVFKCHGSAV